MKLKSFWWISTEPPATTTWFIEQEQLAAFAFPPEFARHKYYAKVATPWNWKVSGEFPLKPPATTPWFIEQEKLATFASPPWIRPT